MDEKFLEFWGNLLISFAKGKKQTTETTEIFQKNLAVFNEFFSKLMQKNLTGFDELFGSITKKKDITGFEQFSAMFRSFYGLDQFPEQSSEYNEVSKKAVQDFQKSFREYLAFTGFIPKDEHIRLVEKYEKLKEKCADQEETIKHLKMIMDGKSVDNGDIIIKSLQSIIKDQTGFFQKMMNNVSQQYFTKKETKGEAGSSSPESSVKDAKQKTVKKGETKDDGNNETESVDKTDG